ncbi:MAG: AAA family ATPase [Pseudomonadota bacterium]
MSRESDPFPVRRVDSVEPRQQDARWLIETLWSAEGVGVLGGAPRSLKTWLATELSIAVAAGTNALGRFPTRVQGPVLFFGAEDEAEDLRIRIEGIAAVRGIRFPGLPIFILDSPQLSLDSPDHLLRLRKTIESYSPTLLVFDPFVRLVQNTDENSATDVSAVLGSLRAIQREFHCAIVVTHHTRKMPSAHLGQMLRGSGDFAAWSSSALYITCHGHQLLLRAEHRNAPAPAPLRLWLESKPHPHLCVADPPSPPTNAPAGSPAPDNRVAAVIQCLSLSPERAKTTVELRETLRIRKATLVGILVKLRDHGIAIRTAAGWRLQHNGQQIEMHETQTPHGEGTDSPESAAPASSRGALPSRRVK